MEVDLAFDFEVGISDLKRGFGCGCSFGRGVAVMRENACRGTDRGRCGVKGLT